MNIQNHLLSEDLKTFVERLDQSYYREATSLGVTAKKHAQKLQEMEAHQATSQYLTFCNALIKEIEQYIKIKREELVPYLHTLFEKDATGHDCTNCSGAGCNMQHEIQLAGIAQSHKQLQGIIYQLQMAVLPIYSDSIYPDVYRILRNDMAILENSLAEILFIEETQLIPKVKEAQKNINARG